MATGSQVDLVQCFPKDLELTDIELGDSSQSKKPPRRIIHFSDGIYEEYSTDEETTEVTAPLVPRPPKNFYPRSLDIIPYLWFYLSLALNKSYKIAENAGEKICWVLGITSPKYQYAIDEYYRIKREEEMEKKIKESQEKFWGKYRLQSFFSSFYSVWYKLKGESKYM